MFGDSLEVRGDLSELEERTETMRIQYLQVSQDAILILSATLQELFM